MVVRGGEGGHSSSRKRSQAGSGFTLRLRDGKSSLPCMSADPCPVSQDQCISLTNVHPHCSAQQRPRRRDTNRRRLTGEE